MSAATPTRVNDFTIKIGTVNGTGSASANTLLMKSLFRSGIPVMGKNYFPSNIQGLPTWYEIRVTRDGHVARSGAVDIMVAMNAETYARDVKEVAPGGYLVYDSTWPRPALLKREDITVFGVPLARLCNENFSGVRTRILMKNICYAGVLAALLDLDLTRIRELLAETYAKKLQLVESNMKAIQLGYDYASANFTCPLPLHVEQLDKTRGNIMIDGNTAAALGCVFAGATVAAWYPITPSTSLMDAFKMFGDRMRVDASGRKNFAFIQAEDELAAIGMVIGAMWNGARAFTATSGPGISLMNEFLGLAYYAEIPTVVFDIQRVGPSTGMPTRTQQSDLLSCAYASNGDTKHVLLFPEDPKECFDFAADALDLADRLQTPVFVMSDLDIGMNHRLSRPLKWDDARKFDRGKVMTAADLDAGTDFGRYLDVDGDGIPYRTYPGTHATKGSFFTRGTSRDRYARYTEDGPAYQDNMQRLLRKFETAKDLVPRPLQANAEKPTKYGVIYYGSTSPAMDEAIHMIEARGQVLDRLRVRAFPFHSSVASFLADHDFVFVVEQNRDAQMRSLIVNECGVDPVRLVPILNYDGSPITARFIAREVGDALDALKVTPLRKVVS